MIELSFHGLNNITDHCPGVYGVERFGRKKLLLGSMTVMMLGLTLLGIAFIVINNSAKAMEVEGNIFVPVLCTLLYNIQRMHSKLGCVEPPASISTTY